MHVIRTRIPQVALLLPTSVKTCRELLRGILQYVHFHGPWNVHLIEGREGEQKMLHPETWGCTGVIGSLNGLAPARRLLASRVPTICTNRTDEFINAAHPLSRLSCVVCDNRLILTAQGVGIFTGEWKGVLRQTQALMISAVVLMLAAISAMAFMQAK